MEDLIKEEVFQYLDTLRESGVTNMFGAGPYLMEEFDISGKEARALLVEWRQTFSERQEKAK